MTDEKLIEAARVAYVEAWEAARKKIGRGIAEPGTKSRAGITAAFAVFEKAHTKKLDTSAEPVKKETDSLHVAPIDDEREVFEALADRLGEHPQASNYEIADSGEYETKLRGPVDVEVLAEWLMPTVLGLRRSEVPEPQTAYEKRHESHGHAGPYCMPEPQGALTTEQRHSLVEGAVDAIEPNVTNRTAAYNTWNNIASDERFVRAIVTFDADRRGAEPQGEPSATDLLDAIYDPADDGENDSVRFGFVVGQYERLRGKR